MSTQPKQLRGLAAREHLIDIAADLFYRSGVHAVGVDEVVRQSGMAKSSLYRWFPSKDELVLAVLERRDGQFWQRWDACATVHHDDPRAELEAHLTWMEELATWENYRGCAFVNTAGEFDLSSSAIRDRCTAHEHHLAQRLRSLTARLNVADSEGLADNLHLIIVGAFALGGLYPGQGPASRLRQLGNQVLNAHTAR